MLDDDPKVLEQINSLGEKIAPMFDGYSDTVVMNVAAALFIGAAKNARCEKAELDEWIDFMWDRPTRLVRSKYTPS